MNVDASRSVRIFSGILSILGSVTVATNLIGLVRFGSEVPARDVLALVYGAAALVAGGSLWRRSATARAAYLAWCITIPLFLMTFPSALDPYLIPGYLGAIGVLAWGYSFVRRHTPR